jgi:hypothetical protein
MATTTSKVSQVGNNFYSTSVTTNTDGSLKATTSRTDAQGNNGVPVSTVNTTSAGVSTRTFESGATAAETAAFNNPNSPERQAYTQQVTSQSPFGADPTAAQQTLLNSTAGTPNAATTAATAAATAAAAAAEAVSLREGTRTSYGGAMKYPENLALESQDVIKFSILEYTPSLAGAAGVKRVVTLEGGSPIVTGSKRIGVITLPIPAGISDSNTVGWQSDSLNVLQEAAGQAANMFLSGSTPDQVAAAATKKAEDALKTGDMANVVRGTFVNLAGQAGGLAQRTQGAVLNNNVELLFSGPSLRSFSFTFMFYPRSSGEAKNVKQIIRTFKQAMSVKRSESSLLLKSPHTFAISYMTAGQGAHPYLNSFKECALTSCGVEYTPDGSYMTYGNSGGEKSMTAYRLSLSFQELEPIFDDEYPDDNDATIGF